MLRFTFLPNFYTIDGDSFFTSVSVKETDTKSHFFILVAAKVSLKSNNAKWIPHRNIAMFFNQFDELIQHLYDLKNQIYFIS